MKARKQKNGALLRFEVRDAVTGASMRDAAGQRVIILAHTSKAARHRAKAAFGGGVLVQRAGEAA